VEAGYSRRIVFFPSWLNWVTRLSLPATDYWYHVRFYADPDLPALLANGLRLDVMRGITSDLYAFYLSPDNASFLLRSKLAEVARVGDKMDVGKIFLREADYLIVDTAPVFDDKGFPSIQFTPGIDGGYLARSQDLGKAARVLSKCPPVYAITPARDKVSDHEFDPEVDSPTISRWIAEGKISKLGKLRSNPRAGFKEKVAMFLRGEFDTSERVPDEEFRAATGLDDEEETRDIAHEVEI
jgi:hypothetical protein